MDTESDYFRDCMDLEDSNDYPTYLYSPDPDVVDGESEPPHLHVVKAEVDGMSLSPLSHCSQVQRGTLQDATTQEEINVNREEDDRPLFIDPQLYTGERQDVLETQNPHSSADDTRPLTGSEWSSKSATRTSQSASSSTDMTMSDETPKKQKMRKTRNYSILGDDGQDRSKFLERNRIAASKCREKRKQYVSDLECTKNELERQNTHLQMEYTGLLGEIGGLKHHLMAHAKCNDPNIDRWLNNEAMRIVQTHVSQEMSGIPFLLGHAKATDSTKLANSRDLIDESAYKLRQCVQVDGLDSDGRRDSTSYSHGSSMQTSPTDAASPPFSPLSKREPGINFDYMPDVLFSSDKPSFGGG